MMTQYGMVGVAGITDDLHRIMPDGEYFNVITNGKGRMQAYAPQIKVRDRWAIVAYLRALMRSQNATLTRCSRSLARGAEPMSHARGRSGRFRNAPRRQGEFWSRCRLLAPAVGGADFVSGCALVGRPAAVAVFVSDGARVRDERERRSAGLADAAPPDRGGLVGGAPPVAGEPHAAAALDRAPVHSRSRST